MRLWGDNMIQSKERINLNMLAYSPVETGLSKTDQWQESTSKTPFDNETIDYFKEYVMLLWNGNTEKKPYPGLFLEGDIQKKLDKLCQLDTSQEKNKQKFDDYAQNFSNHMIDKIGNKNIAKGLLFTLQFQVINYVDTSGEPPPLQPNGQYISFLKVDVKDTDRLRLKSDHTLKFETMKEVLPEPTRLQKGAIYPKPPDEDLKYIGDLILVQTDVPTYQRAQYFHEFFNAGELLSSEKQFYEMMRLFKIQKPGNQLDFNDINNFYDALKSMKKAHLDIKDIMNLGEVTVGPSFDETKIKGTILEKSNERIKLDRNAILKKKIKIQIDGIDVVVPQARRDTINIQKTARGNYIVCIEGMIIQSDIK